MKKGVDTRLLSCPITGIGEVCRTLYNVKDVPLYLYRPLPIDNNGLGSITRRVSHGGLTKTEQFPVNPVKFNLFVLIYFIAYAEALYENFVRI
jgi:hypothetical protein